eukprot:TRINITY_DN8261_c0_g1_i2.p2 TRINITY_DN8261_c0_g1~~TRINITY_DN8261_c0_g1_i2.p2  ORF type:complete len:103 (-),score=22.35 TRINITY_DN8261_c0_g1_i2:212-520(-)
MASSRGAGFLPSLDSSRGGGRKSPSVSSAPLRQATAASSRHSASASRDSEASSRRSRVSEASLRSEIRRRVEAELSRVLAPSSGGCPQVEQQLAEQLRSTRR